MPSKSGFVNEHLCNAPTSHSRRQAPSLPGPSDADEAHKIKGRFYQLYGTQFTSPVTMSPRDLSVLSSKVTLSPPSTAPPPSSFPRPASRRVNKMMGA